MKDNVVSFEAHVEKEQLKDFSDSLFKQVVQLGIENEQLRKKIEHLEELLMNVNVPEIGK